MLYPQHFIDELKNRADIVRIIGETVELKKKGSNWMGCCPFHQEKTPSFSVSANKGFYKCFGCLEENELIWTERGLKKIGSIEIGQKVLDKNNQWQTVIDVIKKESDMLLGITTEVFRYDPLWLTSDHTCLYVKQEDAIKYLPYVVNTSERLKFYSILKNSKRSNKYKNKLKFTEAEAQELKIGDYFAFPVTPNSKRINKPLISENKKIISPKKNLINGYRIKELPVNKKTARLYGLWVAEGSVGRGFVRWTFSASEIHLAEEVVNILKQEFDLEAQIYHHGKHKNICEVNCSKTDLAKQFVFWFGKGASGKKIPAESIFWTKDVQKEFLKGYREGDAEKNNISKSVSRKLSYGLFALAIQTREFISLLRNDKYTDKNGQKHSEFWTQYPKMLESLKGFYEKIDDIEYYFSPIKEIEEKKSNAKVIDITVENTNSFLTKLGVVHNCGKGGNVFTFLMESQGMPFPEAVEEVASKTGVPLPEPVDDKTYQKRKERTEKKKKLADKVIELNQIALEFWEEYLQNDNPHSNKAREYLEKRELDEETIKTFRIGFAPDSWDTILNLLKEKGFEEKLIRESGLVSINEEKDRVYDKFRGRIIFPILDINGQPIAFGARTLGDDQPKYLNSPETPAYVKGEHLYGLFQNKDEIRRQKYGILVEGYMDLIALYQFGVKNCVASLGTAFTGNQAKLLGRAARKVVVNYDGDAAGIKAAKRAIETLLTQDFEIKVLVLPNGNDPDDYIRSEGFDAYKNQHKTRALPYLQFVLETIVADRNLALPKQKATAVEDILPIIASVRNTIEKRETLKQALHYFQINDRVLEDFLWKEIQSNKRYANSEDLEQFENDKIKKLIIKRNTKKVTVAEQRLLELLIHDQGLRKELLPQIEETDYETLALATIFETLFYLNENDLEVNSENLIELSKEDEIATDLVPILLMSEAPREEDEAIDEVLIEAENCLATLRSMAISRRILEISQELAFAEQIGDAELLNNLVSEQIELARMRRDLQGKLVDY